jgi:hypothetical protein
MSDDDKTTQDEDVEAHKLERNEDPPDRAEEPDVEGHQLGRADMGRNDAGRNEDRAEARNEERAEAKTEL